MSRITLIIGGARSGKSSFALKEGEGIAGKKAFIATSEPFDEEMRQRIKQHKQNRDPRWDTYEEPLDITKTVSTISNDYNSIVIDCMTLWVSNLILAEKNIENEMERFLASVQNKSSCHFFIVSNEVGLGIVPEYPTAREYRDHIGSFHKKIAQIADEVYFMIAGIPMKIKG